MTYETQVTIPLLAKHTFHGDAGTFSAMTVAMGIGAVVGGMLFAVHLTATRGNLLRVTALLGLVTVLSAAAPTLPEELGVLTVLGASSVAFLAVANATLQLSAPSAMRGSGDVAVVDGLHRLQSDRGANHRRRRPALRSAVGGRPRWVCSSRGRGAGLAQLRRLPGGLHTVPRAHVGSSDSPSGRMATERQMEKPCGTGSRCLTQMPTLSTRRISGAVPRAPLPSPGGPQAAGGGLRDLQPGQGRRSLHPAPTILYGQFQKLINWTQEDMVAKYGDCMTHGFRGDLVAEASPATASTSP